MSETAANEQLPEFAGFRENARAGYVAFPHCRTCGRFHWYPMPLCPHCRGRDIEWRRVAGTAEIFSFTRVMHPFDPSRVGALPYIVALVTFPDAPGVRLITNIIGEGLDALRIGQTVVPRFTSDEYGRPMVVFRPT